MEANAIVEDIKHIDSLPNSGESVNSEERLRREFKKLALDQEFPELPLSDRKRLISIWRERDKKCMDEAQHRFFQHTNFVGEWRVSDCGSISILPHGTIRRRQIRQRELTFLVSIEPDGNVNYRRNDPDIENTSHLLSIEPNRILEAEMRGGGGSSFFIVPRIVLLAGERLGGM